MSRGPRITRSSDRTRRGDSSTVSTSRSRSRPRTYTMASHRGANTLRARPRRTRTPRKGPPGRSSSWRNGCKEAPRCTWRRRRTPCTDRRHTPARVRAHRTDRSPSSTMSPHPSSIRPPPKTRPRRSRRSTHTPTRPSSQPNRTRTAPPRPPSRLYHPRPHSRSRTRGAGEYAVALRCFIWNVCAVRWGRA